MPSEEGPAQKIQRQSQDSATIGDIVDFTEVRMLADKEELFDTQQSVRNCTLCIVREYQFRFCLYNYVFLSANRCIKQ